MSFFYSLEHTLNYRDVNIISITLYFGTLAEEFLLVMLDEEHGNFHIQDTFLSTALSGAVLLELTLHGSITLEEDNVVIIDDTPLEDEILQKAMKIIIAGEENRNISYWLHEIRNEFPHLKERYIDRMITKEILKRKKEKVLLLIPVTRLYPEDKNMCEIIKHRVHEIVDVNEESDPRALAFLSLLYATNSIGEIFSTEELKKCRKQVRNLIGDEQIGKSVSEIIDTIMDALMRSIMYSSTTPI